MPMYISLCTPPWSLTLAPQPGRKESSQCLSADFFLVRVGPDICTHPRVTLLGGTCNENNRVYAL